MEIVSLVLIIVLQLELGVGVWLVLRQKRGSVRTTYEGATFVDTSALIDGRILSAVNAGFFPDRVVIPKSVLAELQLLADSSDSDKRSRARHGLDVATMLRESKQIKAVVMDDGEAKEGVDTQLRELAEKYNGSICTIDYNLAKVAVVEGIPVLNINELAQQLRMNYLPGEKVSLAIMQKGNDGKQGVGYLADGTMVVVEQAKADIGKTVEVEFIRSLQTVAGRMMFAKKVTKDADTASKKSRTGAVTGRRSTQRQSNKKIATGEDAVMQLIDQTK